MTSATSLREGLSEREADQKWLDDSSNAQIKKIHNRDGELTVACITCTYDDRSQTTGASQGFQQHSAADIDVTNAEVVRRLLRQALESAQRPAQRVHGECVGTWQCLCWSSTAASNADLCDEDPKPLMMVANVLDDQSGRGGRQGSASDSHSLPGSEPYEQ